MDHLQLLRHPRYDGQIVRPALKQDQPCACVGFSLGRVSLKESNACFDFALVALRFKRLDGLDWAEAPGYLLEFFTATAEVAALFDRQVIGLWSAWTQIDDSQKTERVERDAWLAKQALILGLPFVSVTPIDQFCRWWGTSISQSHDFPNNASRAKRTKGWPCAGPSDNPRRVRSEWNVRRAKIGPPQTQRTGVFVMRQCTEEEYAELDRIAAKYVAGTVTEEEMVRAHLLEGHSQQWAEYLARYGYPRE